VFLVPVFITLATLAARNYSITKTFTPAVMNPGYVFFEGNNPNANGQYAVYPPMIDNVIDDFTGESDPAHTIYRIFSRKMAGTQLSINDVNSFWARKAADFIADHPWYAAKRFCWKAVYALHNARFHDIVSVVSNDISLSRSIIPAVPFGLIAAMAVAGALLSAGSWKSRFVVYSVFACQISVMVLTYASDRQRVSILCVFVFFACELCGILFRKDVSRRLKVFAVSVTACFCFATFYNWQSVRDTKHLRRHFDAGQNAMFAAVRARHEGDIRGAARQNALAHAHIPYFEESRLSGVRFFPESFERQSLSIAESLYTDKAGLPGKLDLLTLLLQNHDVERADTLARWLVSRKIGFNRAGAQSSQPYFYRARIEEMKGNSAEAVRYLKAADKLTPGDPWVLSHLAVLTKSEQYQKLIERYFSEIDANYCMGIAYLENHDYQNAVKSLVYIMEKVPEYRNGLIYYALALAGTGEYQKAAEYYASAMQKKQDLIFREDDVLGLFRNWTAQDPSNLEAMFFYAVVLKDFGLFGHSLELLKRIREKEPDNAVILDHIAMVEGLIAQQR
jgi:tetratricopeptide (TPR) repeat protein